jgi:soluble lytic murein transglycosylase
VAVVHFLRISLICAITLACGEENIRIYDADTDNDHFILLAQQRKSDSTVASTPRVDSSLIQSWLILRKAAETEDSTERAKLYRQVTLPVAADRIPWVEAQTLEKFKQLPQALAAYQKLPAPISVFRVRYALAVDSVVRDSIRKEFLNFLNSSPNASLVREGYQLFDKLYPKTTPQEELILARAAADIGAWGRAAHGFERAAASNLLTNKDRFRYATALHRLRQFSQAAAQYAKVSSPRSLVAAARYQRARTAVSLGNVSSAKEQLRAIEKTYPTDTSAAAALTLLADLEGDAGRDAQARKLFYEIIQRFPSTRFARAARFNAALTSYVLEEYKTAVKEFSVLTGSADSIAAQYWLGRARLKIGDSAGAQEAWREVIRRDSMSYYGALAAQRLKVRNIHDVDSGLIVYPSVPSVDSAILRIAMLRALGMTLEVRYENDRLFRDASLSREHLLATAAAFAGTDQAGRAIALGWRALSDYGASVAIYRLIYPLAARDTIVKTAREFGIDPILVASLIRQESNFNPQAISPVGARGLMQLMPNVASGIAARRGISPWSTEKLYDAGINITLGVTHLASLIRAQSHVVRVLAAYNAGESRVVRWAKKAGADDPELFTERIPFAETRGYVKSILRNRELYRALYTW